MEDKNLFEKKKRELIDLINEKMGGRSPNLYIAAKSYMKRYPGNGYFKANYYLLISEAEEGKEYKALIPLVENVIRVLKE